MPTAIGQDELCFGYDVLQPFDVDENERDFLVAILQSSRAPRSELELLINLSLTAGAESWETLIGCARSLQARGTDPSSLEGNDLLTFLWYIFQPSASPQVLQEEWKGTDQLIALAKHLELQASTILPSFNPPSSSPPPATKSSGASHAPKRKRQGFTSHYWAQESEADTGEDRQHVAIHSYKDPSSTTFQLVQRDTALDSRQDAIFCDTNAGRASKLEESPVCYIKSVCQVSNRTAGGNRNAISPYFASSPAPQNAPSKRLPPGTISCVPFPPLDSESFGLVQEKVAHEPFWLLVAITFLIRTRGTAAIPVFYAVKKRFASPASIADPENADEILGMIRHLGLSMNRLGFLQKYARIFIDNPPQAGQVYRVRNYDRRDTRPAMVSEMLSDTGGAATTGLLTPGGEDQDAEAWEIGHMTQGKYALDSWRIFCRDVLLGRAKGWNGEGTKLGFQPEWMRVRPDDKELRAYLRWMWMREGWEWDPVTGERAVLRGELLKAVNQRRVEYDDSGGLRILEEPRPSAEVGGTHDG